MRQKRVMLRGLARREGEYWASIVLEFNIVGTGDTPEDAIKRSISMTAAYLEEGRAAGKRLDDLKRPAPLGVRANYYFLYVRHCLFSRHDHHGRPDGETRAFSRPVPGLC